MKFNIPILTRLWEVYQERLQYRKQVQRRFLRLKKASQQKNIKSGFWTDRFLNFSAQGNMLLNINVVPLIIPTGFFSWKLVFPLVLLIGLLAYMPVMAKSDLDAEFTLVTDSIQPLKVGDRVPEKFWEMPLQVINHPDGKSSVKLSEYRDKLIILDFWSTWCSACIKAMPRMDSLNRTISGVKIIPVNSQQLAEVKKFSATNPVMQRLKPFSVVGTTPLADLFPHTMEPHEVWIKEGKIVAITGSSEVNELHIRQLKNQSILLPVKQDVLAFDAGKPFLVDDNGGADSSFVYRSIFTAYKPGIPAISGWRMEPERKQWRVYAYNANLLRLYTLAFRELLTMSEAAMEIRLPSEYLKYTGNAEGKAQWKKEHLFCYELNLPAGDKEYVAATIIQDLNRYLQLNGRMEQRNGAPYFILEKANPNPN